MKSVIRPRLSPRRTSLPQPLDSRPAPLNPSVTQSMRKGILWESAFRRGKWAIQDYEKLIEGVCSSIAETLGLPLPQRLVITSSVEEARASAIFGLVWAAYPERKKILIVEGDPMGIWEAGKWWEKLGWELIIIPINAKGHLDLDYAIPMIDNQVIAVILASATPEILVSRWEEIAILSEKVHYWGGEIVVDITLHLSSYIHPKEFFSPSDEKKNFPVPLDLNNLSLVFDGSSLGSPMGLGCLYLKPGLRWSPPLAGGTLQGGLRAGWISPTLLWAAQTAASLWNRQRAKKLNSLKKLTELAKSSLPLALPRVRMWSFPDSLPSALLFSLPGIEGEAVIRMLETQGIYLSTGSMCLRSTERGSAILRAIGMREEEINSVLDLNLLPIRHPGELKSVFGAIVEVAEKLYYMAQ
ncbi:MAG: hypothetical protein ACK4OO_02840 [bacterium]